MVLYNKQNDTHKEKELLCILQRSRMSLAPKNNIHNGLIEMCLVYVVYVYTYA